MELFIKNKKDIVSEGIIQDSFYEDNNDDAATIIALSLIKKLYENNLINDAEYKHIKSHYDQLNIL